MSIVISEALLVKQVKTFLLLLTWNLERMKNGAIKLIRRLAPIAAKPIENQTRSLCELLSFRTLWIKKKSSSMVDKISPQVRCCQSDQAKGADWLFFRVFGSNFQSSDRFGRKVCLTATFAHQLGLAPLQKRASHSLLTPQRFSKA
ncbi:MULTISPECIES: hypothetical protein [Neisseria]|uniref:Uncharacterized protein n=1 Tax=Neisseria macacae ATCC 33926 TaxID=997348 RepID=A0ABY3Y4S6_9NEIS|nr:MULTISPECIES: hypothetical protein [Neisseria]UNV84213.1 hypothetical protein MON40_09340 [Neisseria macacae ATCC 33926]